MPPTDDSNNALATSVPSRPPPLETVEGYRLLIESVQDYGIFFFDPQGRVASWNTGAERLLGYQEEEILGCEFTLFFTPEDIRDGAPEHEMRTALEKGRATDDRWHVKKDGSRFFGSGITTPLRDEDGRLLGFVKILRDFTERKRYEEELRNRAEALARADREKDEFLAVLAHELRNPLASIFYALHLLEEDTGADARRQARRIVDRQVRQLARLIDDLLDASRITTGKIELRKERIELRPVVEHALETARPILEERRHEVAVSLPREPVWLEADAARLEQVLANLLNNAAKFTESGGRIGLAAERRADEVVLRVRDTGMGIPSDVLPRIFELFIQGNRSLDRALGGLGIGLTLSRKLVEMHGGTIAAASEGPGRGSEFIVTLPAAPEAPAPRAAAGPAAQVRQLSLRVLVVDDSQDAADMLATLLVMAGHEVRTAYSGPAALEAAAAFRPDAVVLDIGLPGLDGYQVAERLRRDPALKDALLIAASGYGQEEDKRRSREAGFDHHLVKPVDLRKLQEILALAASPQSLS